ncbi:MAG TPA: helix-turn-helix domain-containing protein, partial [Actinophytocola sp.]|uniref:helix-turn-helix domain-containing protein n=1 Tax=Actinophytocola sp. TaxID=1872138 RepID=UPI002DDD2411
RGALAGRRLSIQDGMRTLVAGYLRELVKPTAEYRGGDATGLATCTVDLAAALLAHELDRADALPPETRDQALLLRILTFMRERLGDPDLSPDMIAAAHYISTRYLHKLFRTQDLTVAAWIRHQRLARCHRDLGDPVNGSHPIHAIASRWGFTDNAHFSRLFRSTYGISPSDYRRLRAGGA